MNNAMSLKAKIRNIAKEKNIPAQVILQNYMFERFLARLSKTGYKEEFVIKGGMLVAAIVGIECRATMDLDTTVKNLLLSPETIRKAMEEISSVDLGDFISYDCYSISPIRNDDIYGGYRVMLNGKFDTLTVPMSIDISTGDVITPKPVLFSMGQLFDGEEIEIYAYNVETIMAEKLETILRRGIFNTRPRDYYDAFILSTTQKINPASLKDAIVATAKHRGTLNQISEAYSIVSTISQSRDLRKMWEKYSRDFFYAKDISFDQIIAVLKELLPEKF